MSIDNPVLSQTEEAPAQEWGEEADEAFSLVAQLLGDILVWLGNALPLSPWRQHMEAELQGVKESSLTGCG